MDRKGMVLMPSDFMLWIMKGCLIGGLLLLVFFGLFFRLIQLAFSRKSTVTGRVTEKGDDSTILVATRSQTISIICPPALFQQIQVGDEGEFFCNNGKLLSYECAACGENT